MFKRIMLLGAILCATILGIPAAAGADTSTRFSVTSYGSTAATGNIIWYNRSVKVGGTVRAPNGCAQVYYTFAGAGVLKLGPTRSVCNGAKGHGFLTQINKPGGVKRVTITLRVWSSSSKRYIPRNSYACTRNGCERTYPITS